MRPVDLAGEMQDALRCLAQSDVEQLTAAGINVLDIVVFQMIGAGKVRVQGRLYEPDPDGGAAFITPIRADHPETPESADARASVRCGSILDLLAWHPRHPRLWALRLGCATWAGAIESKWIPDPFPIALWRSPLNWLRARGDGLLLLTDEPPEMYRLLADVHGIIAEDEMHRREIARALSQPRPIPPITYRRVVARDAA